MIRNVDSPIVDLLTGEPAAEAGKPVTIRSIIVNSLLGQSGANQNATGEEKAARYMLAVRVAKGGDVSLTAEDIVTIKALVGSTFLPLVVGQVFEWCERDSPDA